MLNWRGRMAILAAVLAASASATYLQAESSSARILANDNRLPAGSLENGVLTLRLEMREADWYPEADTGPSMRVYAFGEENKPPQVPGPLIRVPEGTVVQLSLHNLLSAPAVVHGLHRHPGDANDTVQVPPGEVREARFLAGAPGTYQYWASAGGPLNHGRACREDSQLAGALIVDPAGKVEADRVFVIGVWQSQPNPLLSHDVPVINGKSWPYTERLTYRQSEPVRWRWINVSALNHPMHLHGSYFRVDSMGDGERDEIFEPAKQRMVVTQLLSPGTTMSTFWTPPAGRWIFHCHVMGHVSPQGNVANALGVGPDHISDHVSNHMAGLVLGITVTGERPATVSHGRARKLRLLVRERPASKGLPAGFGYQLVEPHKPISSDVTVPGPALVLERDRPVEITVVNQLHEPTAVHWHGIELESYYDGVVGWGMQGQNVTPAIKPGGKFLVRFTPPRAGTFIYHTHLSDEVQLSGGLYGPLIVLEPGASFDATSDQIFVLSRAGSGPSAFALLNGSTEPAALSWQAGKRYRLRLINIMTSNFGTLSLIGPSGLAQWRALAKDGADLSAGLAVMQDARQLTWAGETYDFEYQPKEPGSLRLELENQVLHWKIVQQIVVQ